MLKQDTAIDAQVVDSEEFIEILDYSFSGNDVTIGKKRAFLKHYVDCHTIYIAAARAGINKITFYRWQESDKEFAKAFEDTREDSTDALETSMYERAKEKDTIAGIFLLKAYRPEFRDKVTIDIRQVNDELENRIRQAIESKSLPLLTTSLNESSTTSPQSSQSNSSNFERESE